MMRQKELDPNPLRQFERWFEDAIASGEPFPEAMALATASLEAIPSVRMVLFKGIREGGFEFFTNLKSRKGRELESNPNAAAVFWWQRSKRQLRLEGSIEKLSTARAEQYFRTRQRGSQIGAWASMQSQVISGREELESRVRTFEKTNRGRKVTCPPFWGGFRLIPSAMEFWQERENRLHDRFRYRYADGERWIMERLAP
jgi:pyridoxamine 5'-phosphate oxidase